MRICFQSVGLWACLLGMGCGPSVVKQDAPVSANSKSAVVEPAVDSAVAVWDKMLHAYRTAAAYSDAAVMRVQFDQGGAAIDETAPFAVAWERPHKLRVKAYQAEAACDGKLLRAHIRDAGTNDLDGQFVERPAPDKLSVGDLFTDRVLYEHGLASGDAKHPMTLELLLAEQPLEEFSQPSAARKLLDVQPFEGHACQRVQVDTPGGAFVFWIDAALSLLRQVEYPTATLEAQLQSGGPTKNVRLVAEYRSARFASASSEAYALIAPEGAKRVRHFVMPPPPLPTTGIGEPVGEFAFTSGDQKLDNAAIAGNTSVFIFFSRDVRHRDHVRAFEALAKSFADRKLFQFAAVCGDGADASESQLNQLAKDWQLERTPWRDASAQGKSAFGVQQGPAFAVLDGDGVIQLFDLFEPDSLATELPPALERIAQGDDLAGEWKAARAQEQSNYARQLALAQESGETRVVALPEVRIAPRGEPRKLRLERQWLCKELHQPGNLLVIEEKSSTRILAFDGWRTVVELSPEGRMLARHELALPAQAAVSWLRTAVDGTGRRWYAAASLMGREAYLFNDQWQLQYAYPSASDRHDGIRDLALADLAGNGTVELFVAFHNNLGVHAISLQGERKWSDFRTLGSAASLAVSPPNEVGFRMLLALNERGDVVRFNQFGHADRPQTVVGRTFHHLRSLPVGLDFASPYCGLAYAPDGRLTCVSLSRGLREEWSLPLAGGAFENQIEPVAHGNLYKQKTPHWLLAGADGGVYVLSADGQFVDMFHYGEALTGLAFVPGDKPLLLVATAGKLEAWLME